MKVVASYKEYSPEVFSTPWIAEIDHNTGKPNLTKSVGKYSGGFNTGKAGELVIFEPKDYQIYIFGQKNLIDNSSDNKYIIWTGENFKLVNPEDLIKTIIKVQEIKKDYISITINLNKAVYKNLELLSAMLNLTIEETISELINDNLK